MPAAARRDSAAQLAVPVAFALFGLGLLVVATLRPVDQLAVGLATALLIGVIARSAITFRENLQMLRTSRVEALSDALTGLSNRRQLILDLEHHGASGSRSVSLVLFDLDGFKLYNDRFGHPAGDALLARLSRHLLAAVGPHGRAYRMGGDEFCALIEVGEVKPQSIVAAACEALCERGEGFDVSTSCGAVRLPEEAATAEEGLRVADARLYRDKEQRRGSTGDQTRSALLQVLQERHPDLQVHLSEVAELARAVSKEMGLSPETMDEIVRAAELHDVGKMAIPDTILGKPAALNEHEWAFMRRHTLIGERILEAAPALAPIARVVRSSHERFDGSGYPDGLAGELIPLGARIIFACDSYQAIVSARPYAPRRDHAEALSELLRCAGTQFDPAVVRALCAVLRKGRKRDFARSPEHLRYPTG